MLLPGGDQGLLNSFFNSWPVEDINKHLPFIYNLCASTVYTYRPAFQQWACASVSFNILSWTLKHVKQAQSKRKDMLSNLIVPLLKTYSRHLCYYFFLLQEGTRLSWPHLKLIRILLYKSPSCLQSTENFFRHLHDVNFVWQNNWSSSKNQTHYEWYEKITQICLYPWNVL